MKRRTIKRTNKLQSKALITKGKLPLSVTLQEGKTTIRQLKGRRFVHFGEFKGKTVSSLELFTSGGDSHAFTIRFQDRTALHFGISPGFTISAEYYKNQGLYDPLVLKRWPEIKSEQL